VQAGALNGLFVGFRVIISASAGSFTGLFVYSPSVGPGNLVAAIAAAPGTDAYGNAYQAGIVEYAAGGGQPIASLGTSFQYAQLNNGTLSFRDISGGNIYGMSSVVISAASYLRLSTPSGNLLFVDSNGQLVGAQPGTSTTPEAWHNLSLNAGFAAGVTTPRYRYEPVGSAGIVRLDGQVSLGAAKAAGAAIATLPAGYTPSLLHPYITVNNLSGAVASVTAALGGSISVQTSGQVQIVPAGALGNVVYLDGITFPLD
jgi:hypothetical protein